MKYQLVIIGGGPAGTGVFFKALKDQKLDDVANSGVAIIERSSNLVLGRLTDYKVNSDTYSGVFLECLEGHAGERLNSKEIDHEAEKIARYDGRSIPLPELKKYFFELGKQLDTIVSGYPNCDVFANSQVTRIDQNQDDSFNITVTQADKTITICADNVLVATGGQPSLKDSFKWNTNKIDLKEFSDKTIHSDYLLKGDLDEKIAIDLKTNNNVVILGGGHSGFSCAHYLLNNYPNVSFEKHAVMIFSNSNAKIHFQSKEEALAHNYSDFDSDDFCPVTNRLFRLAGLRMDGRELYMCMLGMIGGRLEERVQFNYNMQNEEDLAMRLREARLIVQAMGYTFNMPPVYNCEGELVSFVGEKTKRWVDQSCKLLDSNLSPIPNLYAYGLASGFVPSGDLGGESSFNGQTNGLWYYQNILADIVLDQVFKSENLQSGYFPKLKEDENAL